MRTGSVLWERLRTFVGCDLSRRLADNTDASGLDILLTDPRHQRRGAGGMLLKWGVDLADQLNINAYLESSPMAHRLYASHGFEDIDEMVFDMGAWGGSGKHTTSYMLRPVRI